MSALFGIPIVRSYAVPVGQVIATGDSILIPDLGRSPDAHAAVADALEIVRAGLAHLVPRDYSRELMQDLLNGNVR